MAAPGRSGIRLDLQGSGVADVEPGLPVLDHLLERLAHYARWDLALEVEPGTGEAEVAEAGRALGGAPAGGGGARARERPGGGRPGRSRLRVRVDDVGRSVGERRPRDVGHAARRLQRRP